MQLARITTALVSMVMVTIIAVTGQTQKTYVDDDLDKMMKEVGGTVGMMRKAIDGQNAELAKTHATKVGTLFTEVGTFWMSRNVKDAAAIAGEAAKHAQAVEGAIDAKDFTKAAEHAKMLQGTCGSCHSKFRDKGPDGAYRIKP